MENKLCFIKKSTTYCSVGQPEINYYDLSLNTIDNCPCDDILEKTRLLYALWELFTTIDTAKPKETIPSMLLIELKKYFEKYDAPDFAYWDLLYYETLNKFDTRFCVYEVDSATQNLVLFAGEIKIIISKPYENVIDEYGNDIDDSNVLEYKSLTFTQDDDFPILFMSTEQMAINEIEINTYFDQIISIFKKHQFNINNCEDLVDLYRNC